MWHFRGDIKTKCQMKQCNNKVLSQHLPKQLFRKYENNANKSRTLLTLGRGGGTFSARRPNLILVDAGQMQVIKGTNDPAEWFLRTIGRSVGFGQAEWRRPTMACVSHDAGHCFDSEWRSALFALSCFRYVCLSEPVSVSDPHLAGLMLFSGAVCKIRSAKQFGRQFKSIATLNQDNQKGSAKAL